MTETIKPKKAVSDMAFDNELIDELKKHGFVVVDHFLNTPVLTDKADKKEHLELFKEIFKNCGYDVWQLLGETQEMPKLVPSTKLVYH